MKLLAIIPARAGSKRVPGKNIKLLGGKPLIAHTIQAAQQSTYCHTIFVSTDCKEIAGIAQKYNAQVPWLRALNLADDSSDIIDAVIDILTRYQNQNIIFDSILLLQPTSPFRTAESIKKAVELHKNTGKSVVSVNQPTIKPAWFKRMDNEGNLLPYSVNPDDLSPLSLYQLNGSIYLATVEQILSSRSFYSEPTKALIIENSIETIDIDTPLDWALAEKIIE